MKKNDGNFAKTDSKNAKVFLQQHNMKQYKNTSGTKYNKTVINSGNRLKKNCIQKELMLKNWSNLHTTQTNEEE